MVIFWRKQTIEVSSTPLPLSQAAFEFKVDDEAVFNTWDFVHGGRSLGNHDLHLVAGGQADPRGEHGSRRNRR